MNASMCHGKAGDTVRESKQHVLIAGSFDMLVIEYVVYLYFQS